jgi:hypothetical protein
MHRAARDGLSSLLPSRYKPKRSDLLLLSFGEIDCRAHIPVRGRATGSSLESEIDGLCSRYEDEIALFQPQFPGRIAIACVIPPAHYLPRTTHPYESLEQYIAEQVAIRSRMNKRLSAIPNTLFFDCTGDVAAADGSLPPELSDDVCHLDPRVAGDRIVARLQMDQRFPSATYRKCPRHPADVIDLTPGRMLQLSTRPARYKLKQMMGFRSPGQA